MFLDVLPDAQLNYKVDTENYILYMVWGRGNNLFPCG